MPHQEQLDFDDSHLYESIDQWNCFQCHKPISATRPPNFNSDNCSCVEVGSHSTGEYSSYPMIREQPVYHYDTNSQYHTQRPQSYASSSVSGRCPEGPEREDPSLKDLTNVYLPVVPAEGLNEGMVQHATFYYSHLPYPMQKFLGENEDFQNYGTEHVPKDNRFLTQDPYIQSSKKVHGTKLSNKSYISMKSSSSETSFCSYGPDPTTAAGAWAGEEKDTYAMALSGLTEMHLNDNQRMQ